MRWLQTKQTVVETEKQELETVVTVLDDYGTPRVSVVVCPECDLPYPDSQCDNCKTKICAGCRKPLPMHTMSVCSQCEGDWTGES